MTQEEETRRAAMQVEEAALLPAMSRGGYGAAAYGSVKRAADRMRTLRLSDETAQPRETPQGRKQTSPKRNRAALYQILRR